MKYSRSDFIKAGAVSVAAAALPNLSGAQAKPQSSLNDIDHFIILMQENRSFDHYFGTLRGVRGFDDPDALRLGNGASVFRQPDPQNPEGYALPFHLDTSRTSAQRLADLSHAWHAQHSALASGKMDNWLPAHRAADGARGPLTMGYFTRADLPFYYALADAFTLCDGYHCSVLGPTYPNRLYFMTATVDADGTHGGPVTDNSAADYNKTYSWETYPERLERAGVSWQVYFENDDYGLDLLKYFAAFKNAPNNSPLRRKAMTGRPFGQFLADLRSGNLPHVTWILPLAAQCEHPSYLPAAGENYVRQIVEALWSDPKVWSRSALIINYDENDGQFDHVPPPLPPTGTAGEFIKGLPIGLGFRVPCLVISPFSRGGYACGDTFDHTSVLRLLEARFGVEVANLSAWRRSTCGDLTSAFGFAEGPRLDVPAMPETQNALLTVERQVKVLPKPTVPAQQHMPKQEPGTRPRRQRTKE
jgi:phospholipase C